MRPAWDGDTLAWHTASGRLEIVFVGPGVVHVRHSTTGTFRPQRSWRAAQPEAFEPAMTQVLEHESGIELRTSELAIRLHGEDGRLEVSSNAGRLLFQDSGERSRSASRGPLTWSYEVPPDRRFYGFGERTGPLEKRGRRYTCWTTDEWRRQDDATDAMYVAIPFYLALDPDGNAYGLLVDGTHRSTFDLTASRRHAIAVEDSEIAVFLIHGPAPGEVMERLTRLVGRSALPPRWALGYHQARWSYETEDEVEAIATALRHHRVPADAIHFDIDHMDGLRVFTWNRQAFPDPQGLVERLAQQGLRSVVVVDAGVKHLPDAGYDVYDVGHASGYFLGQEGVPDRPEHLGWVWPGLCAFPDHAIPEVRSWWGNLYGRYLDIGVAGFVNDMNEPAMHDRPYDDPLTDNAEPPASLPGGPSDERTDHAELRNVYANLENRGTREAIDRLVQPRRTLLMTRAGSTGLQRDAGLWTGDNRSTWEHLVMSLPQLLNLGLSGVPFTGADIGGFFGDCEPELLIRWTQVGALYPFCRNHSAKGTAAQEPWSYGPEVLAACRRAIGLRYRLMPYLYTLFEEAARTGAPILRPLLFHYPDDRTAQSIDDEALLGASLLVAPVLVPGTAQRSVYLPRGSWFEVAERTWHLGPVEVEVSAPLLRGLPLFVRGASIIPTGPPMRWTDERPMDPLTLHVVPDADGVATGRVYEDDGATHGYERGEWCATSFAARRAPSGAWQVSARRSGDGYKPHPRKIRIIIHGERQQRVSFADSSDWTVSIDSTGQLRRK
jgi:alpha-glucosidase